MEKNEAIGYMVLAMKESGIEDREMIKKIIRNMAYCIDNFTEEHAENELDSF